MSASRTGSESLNPSLLRSNSISGLFARSSSQPESGLIPCILAYSARCFGLSSSGFRLIEYMKISRPTRSPTRCFSSDRQPTGIRLDTVHPRILGEVLRVIFFRLQADRVHEDIAPHSIPHAVLQFRSAANRNQA